MQKDYSLRGPISKWLISSSTALIVLFAVSSEAIGGDKELCYANGPYKVYNKENGPRVKTAKIRRAISEGAKKHGLRLAEKSGWDCKDVDSLKTRKCLQERICFESLYIDIGESENAYSYTIVSLNRGEIVNASSAEEGDLLDSIKWDIDKLLKRSDKYEFEKAKKELLSRPREFYLGETDEPPLVIPPVPEKPKRTKLQRDLTISIVTFGVLTFASAGCAIGYGVANDNIRDKLKNQDPLGMSQSDIEKGRNYSIASNVLLVSALTFGIAAGALAVWLIVETKSKSKKDVSVSPTALNNGGMLIFKGEF